VKTGAPLSVRALILTQTGEFPDYDFQFTDKDGNFVFDDIYFHNYDNKLYLNVGKENKIILDAQQKIPAFHPPRIMGDIWRNPVFQNFIEYRLKDKRFKKFYVDSSTDSARKQNEAYYGTNKVYDIPDLTYDLDEYIQLNDMRDVILEILPNVKIYKLDDQTKIKVYHSSNTDILPDPLFLVNGKVVKDNNFILGMDVRNVKKIDVIFKAGKLTYFGPVANGGVVAIYTEKPIDIPFGTKVNLSGFYKPEKSTCHGILRNQIESPMPNFDPVIYWKPELKYQEHGETKIDFTFNDLASDFEILIQGLNQNGEVFSDRKELSTVKPLSY
jgi:hypothetical protein